MAELEEYIVTLKNFDDLEEFYSDMETPGGNLYIPNRAVVVAHKRPISRNTHYMLTAAEAEEIKKDPRVLDVIAISMIPDDTPLWTTPSIKFSKRYQVTPTEQLYNWGLKRCTEKHQTPQWRSSGSVEDLVGTVSCSLSGKHVDVIIVDGLFEPNHPSFSINNDGTGATRVNPFNWYSLDPIVQPTGNTSTAYNYSRDVNSGHGCHVAGIAAGNENGWARDANIFNICPYPNSNDGTFPALRTYMWDYIRAFHTSKPVNPLTGIKNPTICNCSFGRILRTNGITQMNYRGTIIGNEVDPVTDLESRSAGLLMDSGMVSIQISNTDEIADIEDAISAGIIIVGAAGNTGAKIDIPGGVDYNNYVKVVYGEGTTSQIYYYNRGHVPSASPSAICVGATDSYVPVPFAATNTEIKWTMSCCGPKVNVFAPGSVIISSNEFYNSSNSLMIFNPRNPLYGNSIDTGTSMASPQVCGVLACALELYPNMTQADALAYITKHAIPDQLANTEQLASIPGGWMCELQGAPNLYMYVYPERPVTNSVYPKVNYKLRPTTGNVYPRYKIRVRK